MEYLVVGDIAGQYEALMRLRAKCSGELISVGDLVDRGPDSRKVVEYFMGGGGRAVKGNHEDMLVDYCRRGSRYDPGDWFRNGGGATWDNWNGAIPDHVVDWLDGLPLHLELGEFYISHAFRDWGRSVGVEKMLWDRGGCVPNEAYRLQITGHNSHYGLRWWGNPPYGVCLDTSRSEVLTSIHLPSLRIYSEPYAAN